MRMKARSALSIAALLCLSTASLAATVEYRHPDLTIVARDEPLDAVLKSLGREMRIYITVPAGLNPVVNCDIQQQPVKQAFKNLLGDMSYSLEWDDRTGKLLGLTILAGGEGVAAISSPERSGNQSAPATDTGSAALGAAPQGQRSDAVPPVRPDDTAMAEHEARMEASRAEHEARMETERAEHEARMAEERAAQEVRMQEEVERHEAEMKALAESMGINPGQ